MLVTARLEGAWRRAPRARLVVFQAPGGSGKTTAAEWWLDQRSLPSVRLRLEAKPGLRHVPAFMAEVAARIAMELGEEAPTGDVRASEVVQLLKASGSHGFCLLLDDFHVVANPELNEAVGELIGDLPTGVQVLMTTRVPLGIPGVQKWLARKEAVVVSGAELCWQLEEITAELAIDPETAKLILERTGGWIFAINLLRDAMQQGKSIESFESNERMADYLFDEILAGYPAEIVTFMQRTAVMPEFSRDDCLMLGLGEVDHQLARLEKDRLFLQKSGRGYTYHTLIRQALIGRLPLEERRRLQIKAGRLLFEQEDEACLPILIEAQSWPDAAKAVTYFYINKWREFGLLSPTIDYWYAHLPSDVLHDDPWYLLLYALYRDEQFELDELFALNQRVLSEFERNGDQLGWAMGVCHRTRLALHSEREQEIETWIQELIRLLDIFPSSHPLAQNALDILLIYYGETRPDRARWKETLALLLSHPPSVAITRHLHYGNCLMATTYYQIWGEYRQAVRYWMLACGLYKQVKLSGSVPAGKQGVLACYAPVSPFFSEEEVASIFHEESENPYLRTLIAYFRMMSAWSQGDWEQVMANAEVLSSLEKEAAYPRIAEMYTDARLRHGVVSHRRGDLGRAEQGYQLAKKHNRSPVMGGEIEWHLAWLDWSRGGKEACLQKLETVETLARAKDQKFLLARALLMRALVMEADASDEAIELCERWEYDAALKHHFPEGLALLGHEPVAKTDRPAIAVYTLGGFRVEVNGVRVAWKRSNSQLILLDLLLHPEGSTGEDIELRYWRSTGNSSFRNDVQALRQALEPERPAKESRFVTLEGRRYRWACGPSEFWWDVQEFERLYLKAQTATDESVRRQAVREALALYQADFLPEFQGYQAFSAMRSRLRQMRDALAKQADRPLSPAPDYEG